MEKKLKDLREEYLKTPIPKELNDVVQAALNEKSRRKPKGLARISSCQRLQLF
ncbi:hypothetical protein QFZ73_002946 [Peribacillus sp. V2I11]|nr:hypothetical protein [Peribacillus sp. V2I11]MDQ0881935.1 hypothetical protein [Peribacillus sp. V2I11]